MRPIRSKREGETALSFCVGFYQKLCFPGAALSLTTGLTVQRKLSQNTTFQNGRKCHNTWLAGKIKCGRCGYALASLNARNGVTYLRCKQRADNKSCEGAGTLTAQNMEAFVYGEMVKKMRKFHTLKGGKEQSYNPKLTAARVTLAKTESEIEKLLDTLSGANPLLLQYANTRIEELDAERQKQLRLVADLTANSVSASQIDSITGYLDDWESVSLTISARWLIYSYHKLTLPVRVLQSTGKSKTFSLGIMPL